VDIERKRENQYINDSTKLSFNLLKRPITSRINAHIASTQHLFISSLWDKKSIYVNRFDIEVQVSVFYLKEMKKENDYHKNIPYFTGLVPAKGSIEFPYGSDKAAILVVYDKLGNVLDKRSNQ